MSQFLGPLLKYSYLGVFSRLELSLTRIISQEGVRDLKFSGFKRQKMLLPASPPPAKMGGTRKGVTMNRRSRLKDWLHKKTRDMDTFTIIMGPIIAVALIALSVVVAWGLYEGAVALLNRDKGWILLMIILGVVLLVGSMFLMWWASKAPSKATQVLEAFAKEEAERKKKEDKKQFFSSHSVYKPYAASSTGSNTP